MTGESDRKMTSVCSGSEESKGYEKKIRKERRGTLEGRRRTGNIMRWFAGFSDERWPSGTQIRIGEMNQIKFRTLQRGTKRLL
jgi:hypothetical protein